MDPKKRCIEIYTNKDQKFTLEQRLEKEGGLLESRVLQGFQIRTEEIFSSK